MGWGGDHTAWALQVAALAAEFDVIAFDNRGAGQSAAPDITYSMADMAEDVTGLMDELGVRSAHIAGASMGGMIAQEVALRHPGHRGHPGAAFRLGRSPRAHRRIRARPHSRGRPHARSRAGSRLQRGRPELSPQAPQLSRRAATISGRKASPRARGGAAGSRG